MLDVVKLPFVLVPDDDRVQKAFCDPFLAAMIGQPPVTRCEASRVRAVDLQRKDRVQADHPLAPAIQLAVLVALEIAFDGDAAAVGQLVSHNRPGASRIRP